MPASQLKAGFVYEVGNGQWNIPTLRRLLEEILTTNDRFQDFEIEHAFERAGWRTLLNASRIYQDGSTGLILLAMEDITERKQASEARYRRLFEASKDGIVILDADTGDVAEVNPVAVELLGYSREELLGKKLWEIDLLKDAEAIQSGLQELHQKGIVRYPDLPLKTKDGRRMEVEIVGNVYREADKKVIQFNIRDITERKRAEEALRVNEEQLRQALKMEAVGRLAGGVAHDFNNLLEAILGYGDLMLSRLKKDEPLFKPEFVDLAAACRKDVQEILKAGTKAASLTRQLLAFGRKQVLQTKVLDLNAVVTDIYEMLRRVIGEDIELVNNLDPALGRVKADPGQIEQVIMNLAINSRDAMPKGGKLTTETANVDLDEVQSKADVAPEPGRYVMLAVSDTGCGMDTETRSHIFEPFFTTKPKDSGLGLGLSTVYGIVKQSGGTISVYSEPGSGTSFKIYFPRVDQPAELDKQEAPISPPRGSETILIVEDEEAVRSLAGDIIRLSGYTVLEASGGAEALRICEQYQDTIHLMLTDVIMHQMSGAELAKAAARLRPEMKVLFMSGHTEDAIVDHGVLNPDTAFLPKPFTADTLAIKLREVLSGTSGATSELSRKRISRDVPASRVSKTA